MSGSRKQSKLKQQLIRGEATMTEATEFSKFIPRDYDLFAGLDVDKKSIAVTFTDHGTMQQSLKLPYDGDLSLLCLSPHDQYGR
jgi:hypothetical protein